MGSNGEENSKVYLFRWFVYARRKKGSKISVVVRGYKGSREGNGLEDELWQSSPITFRVTAREVRTKRGSCYVLEGAIDEVRGRLSGVSPEVISIFKNGFPKDWKQQLEDFSEQFAKNLVSESSANSKGSSRWSRSSQVSTKQSPKSLDSREGTDPDLEVGSGADPSSQAAVSTERARTDSDNDADFSQGLIAERESMLRVVMQGEDSQDDDPKLAESTESPTENGRTGELGIVQTPNTDERVDVATSAGNEGVEGEHGSARNESPEKAVERVHSGKEIASTDEVPRDRTETEITGGTATRTGEPTGDAYGIGADPQRESGPTLYKDRSPMDEDGGREGDELPMGRSQRATNGEENAAPDGELGPETKRREGDDKPDDKEAMDGQMDMQGEPDVESNEARGVHGEENGADNERVEMEGGQYTERRESEDIQGEHAHGDSESVQNKLDAEDSESEDETTEDKAGGEPDDAEEGVAGHRAAKSGPGDVGLGAGGQDHQVDAVDEVIDIESSDQESGNQSERGRKEESKLSNGGHSVGEQQKGLQDRETAPEEGVEEDWGTGLRFGDSKDPNEKIMDRHMSTNGQESTETDDETFSTDRPVPLENLPVSSPVADAVLFGDGLESQNVVHTVRKGPQRATFRRRRGTNDHLSRDTGQDIVHRAAVARVQNGGSDSKDDGDISLRDVKIKRKRGRPRQNESLEQPSSRALASKWSSEGVPNNEGHISPQEVQIKRKRGRPRKNESLEKSSSRAPASRWSSEGVQNDEGHILPQEVQIKQKRGRPRKNQRLEKPCSRAPSQRRSEDLREKVPVRQSPRRQDAESTRRETSRKFTESGLSDTPRKQSKSLLTAPSNPKRESSPSTPTDRPMVASRRQPLTAPEQRALVPKKKRPRQSEPAGAASGRSTEVKTALLSRSGVKMSRSGRAILPVLEFWRNQTVRRGLIGIEDIEDPTERH